MNYKNPKEYLWVVDNGDEPLGKETRESVHKNKLLHREVYVYLVDKKKKRILLQRRADSGTWDHTVGGHVSYGESYEEAAIREVKEEIGLKLAPSDLIPITKVKLIEKGGHNSRFAKVFMVEKDASANKLETNPDEVLETKWLSTDEIKELISKGKTKSSLAKIIPRYIFPILDKTIKTRNQTNI